jgi:hypothetical protein
MLYRFLSGFLFVPRDNTERLIIRMLNKNGIMHSVASDSSVISPGNGIEVVKTA